MPLLTELAETVVDSDSYKHGAPTELAGSWRSRCYKLSVISVISCSNPSQQFRTESETPWTGRSETCPTVHIFALFCIKYLQAQMNLC